MADLTQCPVCGGNSTQEFLSRPAVPVQQNRVMRDRDSARSIARGKLTMRVCEDCDFVFNAAFDALAISGQ